MAGKMCNLALIYGLIAKIPESIRKSGSANTMVTSNFYQEVKNMAVSRTRNTKICKLTFTCVRIAYELG